MVVRVDDPRHHRLAGQVHARRTSGDANVTRAANGGEPVAGDDKGGVLDRCTSVADDDARALEDGHVVLRQRSERERGDRRQDEKFRSVHWALQRGNCITRADEEGALTGSVADIQHVDHRG